MWVFPVVYRLQAFDPGVFAENWTVVGLSGIVATVAIAMMFATSWILSSRRRSDLKLTSYECGIPSTPYSWSNINVRFYIFAILFLIFDVEAVFLFPWAVIFLDQKVNQANPVPFYAMLMFLAVLAFAIVYAWRKGALDWKR